MNVPQTIELYTLNEWLLLYVNYIPVKLVFLKNVPTLRLILQLKHGEKPAY